MKEEVEVESTKLTENERAMTKVLEMIVGAKMTLAVHFH